jgi:4-aminobutyrate aminotransferase
MELIDRHRAVVAPMLAFDTDIVADTASGLWVTDADGNRWADFACGTAVTNLGHNHPAVVEAAHTQIDKFMHSGCVFRYSGIVELAEALREITPDGIDKFGFANSGAEVVEAAVKLAKYTTKRQGVVAFRGAFHGRTMGSVAFTTSNAKYRDGYHPVLGSVFIAPFPYPYRWGLSPEAATERSLDELRLILKHEMRPHNLAAFLVEPVQGEGGYYPAPLVFDEIQTGFGRTARWFASDHYDVNPDIIAMGKGIANGLPLSAYGAAESVIDGWPVGAHGTTFGGNPVAYAAGTAVIETMGGASSTMPVSYRIEPSSDSTRWPRPTGLSVMSADSAS